MGEPTELKVETKQEDDTQNLHSFNLFLFFLLLYAFFLLICNSEVHQWKKVVQKNTEDVLQCIRVILYCTQNSPKEEEKKRNAVLCE